MSKVDPAVIYWMDGEELEGLLACHVDDFIWEGTENFKQTCPRDLTDIQGWKRRKQDISIHWDGAVLRWQHNSLTSEQVWRKPGVNPTGKEQSASET